MSLQIFYFVSIFDKFHLQGSGAHISVVEKSNNFYTPLLLQFFGPSQIIKDIKRKLLMFHTLVIELENLVSPQNQNKGQ
jgi:hypothetical protein